MKRVVIVGGGVIGLAAAHAMVRDGAEVTVIEAATPGHGASRVNAGWVCPSLSEPVPAPGLVRTSIRWMLRPDSPLYIKPSLDANLARWLIQFWRRCNARDYNAGLDATARLNQRTLELYDRLEADGVRFEHHKEGLLFAYISPLALESDLRHMEPLRKHGIEVPKPIWGDAVRELEPSLSAAVNGGFLYPLERHVRPDTLTAGLVEWLQERSVQVRTGSPVTGFDRVNGQVNAVRIDGERIPCDAVLIAAGARSGEIGHLLGVKLPFQGGKGYSLDFAPPPVNFKRPVYLHEARVAITPVTGRLRLSGTMEFSGLNDIIRPPRVAAIARGAATAIAGWAPDPAQATIGAGLRPMTPDGLPCIGWLPGYRNAAIAAGHAMLGVTLAPATAELVSQIVLHGATPDLARPFTPTRFA
jgi:D-amino-acid dehydrogenase